MTESIDILLATYCGQQFLESQIDSILAQSHKDFRILVRDDDSKDNTRLILEEVAQRDSRIHVLPSAERLGVCGNFSRLMTYAQADYIAFADQDDIWMSNKLALSLSKMKQLEQQHGRRTPLLVHTDLQVVGNDLSHIDHSFWHYANLNPYHAQHFNKLLVQNVVTGCSMLFNRHLLELATPIPSEAIMHDWWLALVAAGFGKAGIEPVPTLLYRQHSQNVLGAQRFGLWTALKTWKERLKKGSADYRLQAEAFHNRYASMLAPKEKHLLEVYLSLPHYTYLKRRYLMIRHAFYKCGFWRNCAMFFAPHYP